MSVLPAIAAQVTQALPQQLLMFNHMMAHPEACVFAEPGLGKSRATLEVIAALIGDGEIRAALIVAPKRVITLTWPDEREKYPQFAWLKMVDLRTEEGKRAWLKGTAHIYLINYDRLQQFATGLLKENNPTDMVVWDESGKARSHNSKRVKAILPFRQTWKRHVALTGSPAPNSYLDLWGQLRLIDGGVRLGISFHAYQHRYFESDYMGWSWAIRDWAKPKIEEKIADITLSLRRKEWLHIPPTHVEDVIVELPKDVMRQYETLKKQLLLELEDTEIVALSAGVLVQKLLQFTSGAIYDQDRKVNDIHSEKLNVLGELIEKINAPILLACQFIHERKRIMDVFPQAEEFSERHMNRWNEGKIPMWVADPRSVSLGLNLQKGSSNVVWFTPTYSYEQYDQFNCRVIRTGQTKPTTVWRLIVPNSVDEAVVEVLRTKQNGQDALLATLKNLEKLDLKARL